MCRYQWRVSQNNILQNGLGQNPPRRFICYLDFFSDLWVKNRSENMIRLPVDGFFLFFNCLCAGDLEMGWHEIHVFYRWSCFPHSFIQQTWHFIRFAETKNSFVKLIAASISSFDSFFCGFWRPLGSGINYHII